jgi:hypothetical protein
MHAHQLMSHRRGPSPGSRTWTRHDYLELGAFPGAPGCARGHAVNVLREWGLKEFADVAEMVVSELATNSVLATRAVPRMTWHPPIRLWLFAGTAHFEVGVLVHVWDAAGGCPVPREAGPDEESGRGLAIVAALSADWGHYHPSPEGSLAGTGGKITWAYLAA